MGVPRISASLICFLLAGCAGLQGPGPEGRGDGDRAAWQQPGRVVGSLGIRQGDIIADLGSGEGYFTFRLAGATGPSGRVYAVDVDGSALGVIRREAMRRGCANVATIRSGEKDPRLPRGGVDLIFFCNAYHCVTDRADFLRRLRSALRPGGRVAILDFRGRGEHAMPEATIRREMLDAGFRLERSFDYLEKQSFQIFGLAGR